MRTPGENVYLPQGARSGRNSVPPKSRRSSIDQEQSSCPPSGINSPRVQSRVESPVMGASHQSVPGIQPFIPGSYQAPPGSHQSIPGSHQTIPGSQQTIPGSHQSLPGSQQAVPSAHQTVPGSHQATTSQPINPDDTEPSLVKGPARINTLWGLCIRDYAKMCIPDVDVLADYPIDYKFPIFLKDANGKSTSSGFFPGDPVALHNPPTPRSQY